MDVDVADANPSTGYLQKEPNLNDRLKKNTQHEMDWEPWSRAIQLNPDNSIRVTVFKTK